MTIHDSFPDAVPIQGAFEVHDGTTENLTTLTKNGELVKVGDRLPEVPGIYLDEEPAIIQTVNAFGTPTCDGCVNELEQFQIDNPGVRVFSLTKQGPGEMDDGSEPAELQQERVQIDDAAAIELGVALDPGENADADFWGGALRRAVVVVNRDRVVTHVQIHKDQEQKPDFLAVYQAALDAAK